MTADAAARFWAKVDTTGDCWLWTGATTGKGWHGRFSVDGRLTMAHRYSWEMANGPVPDGMKVLHRCDVPACVRPIHLFLGMQADNMRDAGRKGRIGTGKNATHCKRGHPFTEHRAANGRRFCHACYLDRQSVIRARPENRVKARAYTREWKAARAAEAAQEAIG